MACSRECGRFSSESSGSLVPEICSRADDYFAPPSSTLSSHTATDFPTGFRLGANNPYTDALPVPRIIVATDADRFGVENKPKEEGKSKNRTTDKKEDEAAQDESINPAPFDFNPSQLAQLLDVKDLSSLTAIGGIDGIIRGLKTHAERGLTTTTFHTGEDPLQGACQDTSHNFASGSSVDGDNGAPSTGTIDDRKRIYGENVIPTRISKTLPQFLVAAIQDKILILLLVTTLVSLALALIQDFGTPRKSSERLVDWVEGVAIFVAVAVVVVVGSVNNWQKEFHFKALNERKRERSVRVIRDGVEKVIDIKEIVVGDICLVKPGEIIPCDGIFISGHNVQCDESGATGEFDAIQKLSYTDVIDLKRSGPSASLHTDCFMVSGSNVIEGVGKYVVVAVGRRCFNGRNTTALPSDPEKTPLQTKLNILAAFISNVGSLTGLFLFAALLVKFLVALGTKHSSRTPCQWGIEFLRILIISITLVVIAVPEGLTLAVAFALAFATKRMTYDNLLVRVLGSCETMANASHICIDKTGTLTQNVMTVVAGSVGIHAKFVRSLDENSSRTITETQTSASESEAERTHCSDFSIDQAQLNRILSDELQHLFNEAIAVTTAFGATDPMTGQEIFVGNNTEAAFLQFAKELNWRGARETRDAANIVQILPFASDRKVMAVIIKKPHGGYRAYFKGDAEILARDLTKHIVVRQDGSHGIEIKDDDLSQENIMRTIIFYSNQMLVTVALAYRDFDSWPPEGTSLDGTDKISFRDVAKDSTLISIVAFEDPLHQDIRNVVLNSQRAGVAVTMCTGDNSLIARAVARDCGIHTPGGIIMEGPAFRKLSQEDLLALVPNLQVLARSSPEDKKILVEILQQIGGVVGVTGNGPNDGPVLKRANIGFSMGIASTEIAKEASDIILTDGKFASIVKAIMWGRCVHDAVRKFLQFQFTTMTAAVVITVVSSLSWARAKISPAFSVVQLLWISIIMDAFAALALTTDTASEMLLGLKPYKQATPLVTVEMYKMILLQSCYQITIVLVFYFSGLQILGLGDNTEDNATVKTLLFNMFVFAQIFNCVNCRRLDSQLNVFEGILKNRYFIAVTLIEIGIQVTIVFFGGAAFQVTRIEAREWGISLVLGFGSIPWGSIIRLLPNKPFQWLFKVVYLIPEDVVLPIVRPGREGGVFLNIRGGGLRTSAYLNSRQSSLPQDDQLRIPTILTTAPTIMKAAVISDPRYFQAGSRSDPANSDPSGSSVALWDGRLQMHSDTDRDDSVYKRFAHTTPPDL